MPLLPYLPTPVQEIHDPLVRAAEIRLFLKREDLNHPFVSGNKWWKLKYNLTEARRLNKQTLLTFGGAFSNHLSATAAAAHSLGFDSIGIVRGEEVLPLNETLSFASANGMRLHYVSRHSFREKSKPSFLGALRERYGDFYLIPEGGSNQLAVQGVAEFAKLLDVQFDYLCCPVGTGGTLAGLIQGYQGRKNLLGFPALKDSAYLRPEISSLAGEFPNWDLISDYHFGGYAKSAPVLLQFMDAFRDAHGIALDRVYTGKMMYGVIDLIKKQYFKKRSTVLAIHTGGVRHAIPASGTRG
jgi:1-aminocyclopropane-1-carboxylate deaminase